MELTIDGEDCESDRRERLRKTKTGGEQKKR